MHTGSYLDVGAQEDEESPDPPTSSTQNVYAGFNLKPPSSGAASTGKSGAACISTIKLYFNKPQSSCSAITCMCFKNRKALSNHRIRFGLVLNLNLLYTTLMLGCVAIVVVSIPPFDAIISRLAKYVSFMAHTILKRENCHTGTVSGSSNGQRTTRNNGALSHA